MESNSLQRAALLIQHRRFDEASRVLGESLGQHPENAEALRLLGICQYARQDYAGALQIFQRAIALEPEEAELRLWLARVQNDQQKPAAAHATLDEVQAMDPELPDLHSVRSEIFFTQTKWAEAAHAARLALQADADDVTAQNVLTHALMMQGHQVESEAHIRERFARDPENQHTHVAAGYAALRRGSHEEATRHFQEALRINAENEGAREGLLTSFRARSAIYRSFLAFSFQVAKLQEKYRQWLFLGLFVLYKVVVGVLGQVAPSLVNPVIVLYMVFVLWSYVAQGIGTLFILFDRSARKALRPRETWEGILVGGGSLIGVALILTSSLVPQVSWLFVPGVGLAALSIPWSLALNANSRSGKVLYGSLAGLATLGCLLIFLGAAGMGLILATVSMSISTLLAVFGVARK